MEVKWAVGVTTVPERRETLLPRTMASLAGAGFDVDRLFIDGAQDAGPWEVYGTDVTTRWPAIKTYGSFVLALAELLFRHRGADFFAMFQDDVVVCRNLREYLERSFPEGATWLNLLCPEFEERRAQGKVGWFRSQQRGYSGCGLIFRRDAVCALLSSEHLLERVVDPKDAWNYPRFVDGAVATSLCKAGYLESVHFPALLGHTGVRSTVVVTKGWPLNLAPSFREGFDALELLKEGGTDIVGPS